MRTKLGNAKFNLVTLQCYLDVTNFIAIKCLSVKIDSFNRQIMTVIHLLTFTYTKNLF